MAPTCVAAVAMGALGLPSLSPDIRAAFDLSTASVGLLMSVVFLVAAPSSILAGRLIDWIGPAPSLALSQALAAVGMTVVALAPLAGLLYLGMALVGVGFGIVFSASTSLNTVDIPSRSRGLTMGIRQTGATVGAAVAALLLPQLATLSGWRTAALAPVAANAIAGLWALSGVPSRSARPARAPRGAARPLPKATRAGLWVYGFAMSGVQTALIVYVALYLVDDRSFSLTVAGVGYALLLTIGTLARPLWGAVSDTIDDRLHVLVALALASTVATSALAVAPAIAVWPLLALLGVCVGGWNGAFLAVVIESAGDDVAGRASGAAAFFLFAGAIVIPPLLGGLTHDGASWPALWLAAAAISGVVGVGLAVLVNRRSLVVQ